MKKCLEKFCVGFTHAFRDRISNDIPVPSVLPQLWLALGFVVQFPHDPAELCLGDRGVLEERQHLPLVRPYELPVAHIGSVALPVSIR